MKKLLTIFFIIFPAIAIANQINIDKAYKLARDSIEKNKLTKLKQECLSLVEKNKITLPIMRLISEKFIMINAAEILIQPPD